MEGDIIYKLFIGKVFAELKMRKLNYKDLARMTGYTYSSIKAFMCGARESENVANAIATALQIKR